MDDNWQGFLLMICVFACLCCLVESTKDCEKCLMPDMVNPEKKAIYEYKQLYSNKSLKTHVKININNEYVELDDIKILN